MSGTAPSSPDALATAPAPTADRGSRLALLGLFLLVVLPIYLLGAALALRAGLFDFSSTAPLSGEDARALWGFLGAAMAAAVTATGLLLTRSHNMRTLAFQQGVEDAKLRAQQDEDKRLTLDTVTESLKLLGTGPTYATPAAVVGALTTLVHLEHPVIALRCLSAAWPSTPSVDIASAVWLIEAAFHQGNEAAQAEAVGLVERNFDVLSPGGQAPSWLPDFAEHGWRNDVEWDTRARIVLLLLKTLMKKSLEDWEGEIPSYFYVRLDEIVRDDSSADIRNSAGQANRLILAAAGGNDDDRHPYRQTMITMREMKERADQVVVDGAPIVSSVDDLLADLRAWLDQGRAVDASTSEPSLSEIGAPPSEAPPDEN